MLLRPRREAIKNLSKETTTFTLAYAKKLQDTSLFKARLSNNGESLVQPSCPSLTEVLVGRCLPC